MALTTIKQAIFPHESGDYVLEPWKRDDQYRWHISHFPEDESPSTHTYHVDILDAMAFLVSVGASEFGKDAR